MNYKLYEMNEDYCHVVAATTKQEAIEHYNSTDSEMEPVTDASEVDMTSVCIFEDEPVDDPGRVQTWKEYLSDFEYKGPIIIAYKE